MGQAALPAAMVGSSVVGGLFSDNPQERTSFQGTGVDPYYWLSDARNLLGQILTGAMTNANQPTQIPQADLTTPTGLTPRRVPASLPQPRGLNISPDFIKSFGGRDINSPVGRDLVGHPQIQRMLKPMQAFGGSAGSNTFGGTSAFNAAQFLLQLAQQGQLPQAGQPSSSPTGPR